MVIYNFMCNWMEQINDCMVYVQREKTRKKEVHKRVFARRPLLTVFCTNLQGARSLLSYLEDRALQSVPIVTGRKIGGSKFDSCWRADNFLFVILLRPFHVASQPVDILDYSAGRKQPFCDAAHTLSSQGKIRMPYDLLSTTQYSYMDKCRYIMMHS